MFVLLIVSLVILVSPTPWLGTMVLSYLSFYRPFLAHSFFFAHLRAFAYLISRNMMTIINELPVDQIPYNTVLMWEGETSCSRMGKPFYGIKTVKPLE
jgi:hypothetical protein